MYVQDMMTRSLIKTIKILFSILVFTKCICGIKNDAILLVSNFKICYYNLKLNN